MYFSNVILAAGALVPLVSAHGGDGIPHIVGLNVKDLKGRDMLSNLKSRIAAAKHQAHGEIQGMERRQDDKRCGAQYGSCAAGECCSGSGWCGTTADYCYSPGCDWKYGPGCNENKTPKGLNTSTIARPKNGNVPYGGGGIYSCNKAGTIALTFDDGPFKGYTSHILDLFKSYNAKGTFFITGANINKGQIDETPEHADVIKRMHAEGHQIASHTWTHLDLDKITPVERKNQMWKLEMAIRNIVGFFPTYMRPPYSSCGPASGCEKDMADLGYHISYFDVDTDDYNQLTKENIQKSKDWFKGNITANNAKPATHDWLGIAHDIHELTAYNLTEYMLKTLTDLGYKAVTMGECLNDPKENWYRGGAGGSPTVSEDPSSTSTLAPEQEQLVKGGEGAGGQDGKSSAGSLRHVLPSLSLAFVLAVFWQ